VKAPATPEDARRRTSKPEKALEEKRPPCKTVSVGDGTRPDLDHQGVYATIRYVLRTLVRQLGPLYET
jgi:hypothetical protein